MTQFLPPNLLALFAPREPIPYLPPVDKLPHEKKNTHVYHGIAQYVNLFEDPADTPPPRKVETRVERLERKKREKAEQVAYKLEQEIALWDPNAQDDATMDPFKTLFVARVNYYTSENKIRREFESYGPIKAIKMVQDKENGKPRGYCFIEFEHERDMHSAYKHADGKKVDGRRVLVDVERARTVKGWLPRRLGGGLGGTRRGGPEVNARHSGREDSYRGERRSRSRERERRRSRSKSRERPRRHRSRDRKRSRERRSRSRDKRSRSRDRRRDRERKRSRSPRERKRSRRSRDRPRGGTEEDGEWNNVRVKDEPADEGYDGYGYNGDDMNYEGVNVKQEQGDHERKPDLGMTQYEDDDQY